MSAWVIWRRDATDSGLEVISRLKRDRPSLTCAIVSASAEIKTAVEAFRQDTHEYIPKPLYKDEVLAVLDRCFEKRRLELAKEAAEAALAESEARNRAFVDSAVDGIISIDERGAIQSINPAAERIFGYRPDEVVGRNVNLLMPKPFLSEHDGFPARYLVTGREGEGLRKDGAIFSLDLAISSVPQESGKFFIGVIRDNSRRKKTEEALQRAHDEPEARV